MLRRHRAAVAAFALVLTAGCGSSSTATTTPSSNAPSTAAPSSVPSSSPSTSPATSADVPDPPDSRTPTAGACALATGPAADVLIRADFVPMPRCLVIRHDQHLNVTNETGRTIEVTLGTHFKATIDNHRTYGLPEPVGTYLAAGVHRLVFTPNSAADIWVDAVCKGPGASDCATP